MSEKGRLLVVSNRLPVALLQEDSEWKTKRTEGGLATAMDPILKNEGGVWIGWTGSKDEAPAAVLAKLRKEESCVAVDLPADLVDKFYEGYANEGLWPLFHTFIARFHFDSDNWRAYNEANRRFCAAVVNEYQPGDRIWVHDYHLMLLPSLLRERIPEAAIGFFLHIPFPASDVFAILPRGEELLAGLIGADLLAFQTHQHVQHFRMSLRRLAGIESAADRLNIPGREVRLQALPIGIAPQEYLDWRETAETREQLEKMQSQYEGRRVIVAVDRLDYTKGIPERLRTFRRLLNSEPEFRGKIVLLQVAVPSRENIESYQLLRDEVHELISGINGEFGTADWVPIVYIHRGISKPELVAMYERADVAWVSPLRDGMNLVAKEYVACHPDGDGVLVLSSFAGAAAEMGEALLVNPYDQERTAWTVTRALTMGSKEKAIRMRALHERVIRNDVFAWSERFLSMLDEALRARDEHTPGLSPPLPFHEVLAAYGEANKRLLLLDYDGTLVPLTMLPGEAMPPRSLLTLLEQLTSDPANLVYVISGRRAADLEAWLGEVPRLGLAGEHGTRWRRPESEQWEGRAAEAEWKDTVRPILNHFVDRVPDSFLEEKEFSLVWHYRTVKQESGEWLATELVAILEGMLAETDLRTYRGHKIVEIKPIWANKGAFGNDLVAAYLEPQAFIFSAGDDQTDEDLFARLPAGAWSVHVGSGASKAPYRISDPGRLLDVLGKLAEERKVRS